MLTLKDKKELYQWDSGVKLVVDLPCNEVHFSNVLNGEAMTVQVQDNECDVPNQLLIKNEPFYAWAFVNDGNGGKTLIQKKFDIRQRPKPSNFVYTPSEVKTIESVVENALQSAKDSGDFDGKDGKDGKDGLNGRDGVDGKDGKDGETPYIGSNGNWWIGDTDLGVSASGSGGGSAVSGVFIATYGQTTYSDMRNAWKSGQLVVLKGDVESALTIRMLVHVSTDKIFFGRVLAESQLVEEVIVSSGNQWTLIKNNYLTKDTLPNHLTNYATQSQLSGALNHCVTRIETLEQADYAPKSWVVSEGMEYAPKTITKVFKPNSDGIIRCGTNKSYNIYCTGSNVATIRGYGSQNKDTSGNPQEISGKYLTVYCGGQYDTFDDGNGDTLSNNGAALWYATAMTQGTISPIGSMDVRRGVVKHPDGDHWAEISYPAECSIIITEIENPMAKPNASGVSF